MFTLHKLKLFFTLYFIILSVSGFSQKNNSGSRGVFKVTLDAGHGGKDSGATYNGHSESSIALEVVLKVGKILESYKNIYVNYTRKTDVFIELAERANIANKSDADIFVSIHLNASAEPKAFGTETYVMGKSKTDSNLNVVIKENSAIKMEENFKGNYEGYDPSLPKTIAGVKLVQELYSDASLKLAENIVNQFKTLNRRVRGVKDAPFLVLHKAYMPRVLIELGFISNKEECNYMASVAGQDQIVKSIAKAIISYKNEFFGSDSELEDFLSNSKSPTLPENFNVQIPSKDDLASQQKTTSTVKIEDEVPNVKPVVLVPPVTNDIAKPVAVKVAPVFDPSDLSKLTYQVQFFATTTKRSLNSSSFNGFKDVTEEFENGLYKYSCGLTSYYHDSKKTLEYVQANGFPSAFLNVFKDGKKLGSQEVNSIVTLEEKILKQATIAFLQHQNPVVNEKDLVKEMVTDVINDSVKFANTKMTNLVFKIQLFASKILRDTEMFSSKGLKGVEVSYEDSYYKYLYGSTSDYNASVGFLQEAKLKGYPEAFLIAYKEGVKVNPLDYIK